MKSLKLITITVFLLLFGLSGCKKENLETDEVNNNLNGQATLWTSSDLGTITVNINGVNRTINKYYYSGEPSCGASGCANFDLKAGNYTFTASSGTTNWSGNITVTSSNCSKMQLKSSGGTNGGSDPGIQNGKVIFWTNSNLGIITVNINGASQTITKYYTSGSPSCGTSGCATFDLKPGSYNFTASGNNLSWNDNITVTSGGCRQMQLTGSTVGGVTCGSSSIKAFGTIGSSSGTGGNWTAWYKVADVGNGAMYVSYKISTCGSNGLNGYSFYRVKNTCTNLPKCTLNFQYEYKDCSGKLNSGAVYANKLDHEYIDEKQGYWFLGYQITKSFVSGSVTIQ